MKKSAFSKQQEPPEKNEFAEMNSKRNSSYQDRKQKEIYSVILKIDYLYDHSYVPSVFDLKDLLPYPTEENFILLPFTFLYLKKINIDSNQFIADIELEIIGKKEILENEIKDPNKSLEYNDKDKIIEIK